MGSGSLGQGRVGVHCPAGSCSPRGWLSLAISDSGVRHGGLRLGPRLRGLYSLHCLKGSPGATCGDWAYGRWPVQTEVCCTCKVRIHTRFKDLEQKEELEFSFLKKFLWWLHVVMIIFWIYCVVLLKLILPVSSFKVWLLENLKFYVACILFLLGSAGLSPLKPARVGGRWWASNLRNQWDQGPEGRHATHLLGVNILCWLALKTTKVRFLSEYRFPFQIWDEYNLKHILDRFGSSSDPVLGEN